MEFCPKLGMYVWCPYMTPENIRVMLYGQVEEVVASKVLVRFHDLTLGHQYHQLFKETIVADVKDLVRAPALSRTRIKYLDTFAEILPSSSFSNDDKEFYSYYIERKKNNSCGAELVQENMLTIPLNSGKQKIISQLVHRNSNNIKRFSQRSTISKSQAIIKNAPIGFRSLLGTRAELYPHQIDTIVRAFSEMPFRLMLADEVGLGKTIEAGAILKGSREFDSATRAIIVVPDTLSEQWLSELEYRFFIKAQVWVPGTLMNPKCNVYILRFSNVEKCYKAILANKACSHILIVDEAHKLLKQQPIYRAVFEMSKAAKNVLLLSATPVLRHSKENKKLLTLLDPSRYSKTTEEEFQNAVNQQSIIRDHVFSMMRDLPDYLEYDLKDDFLEKLEEINVNIQDEKLHDLIKAIRAQQDPQKNLKTIRIALSYLSEYHRIDRNIIRHRKSEVPHAHAPRVLAELEYTPAGIAENFYEQEAQDAAIELFQAVFSWKNDSAIIQMCKRLFQATASSPHAVLGIVRNYTPGINPYLDRFFSLIEKWKAAYDLEVNNLGELKEHPEYFYSKAAKLTKWIEQEDPNAEKKFLVFSEYVQTAELYATALKNYYGDTSVSLFCRGMDAPSRKASVRAFQNTSECRFLVCDSSGGEGRNFQIADYIVHCDLSWSPAIMEQRIGRLDRIGREQDQKVTSVVIHADHGVENDLFHIYDEGLKVFTHSLCGMEIAFDEIQEKIDQAFYDDPFYGLKRVLPVIRDYATQIEQEVEQERYFDMARQLDDDMTEQLDKLVSLFSNEEDDHTKNALLSWSKYIGIPVKKKMLDYDQSKIVIMDMDKTNRLAMLRHRYALPFKPDYSAMSCTYSRKAAVAHERLYLLAPSNALYESFADNATRDVTNAVAGLHFSGCGIEWEGFRFVWNISYNYAKLLKRNLPPESFSVLSRFMPVGQVTVFVSSEPIQEEKNEEILSSLYQCLAPNSTSLIEPADYRPDLNTAEWAFLVRACHQAGKRVAIQKYKEMVQVERANAFFETKLAASAAHQLWSKQENTNNWIESEDDIEVFLSGIENPLFELDSIAYIIME